MAFTRHSNAAVDEVRPYLHGVAKYLVDQIWGANGPAWGTRLTDIEAVTLAIQQVLSERLLQQTLQRQADTPAADRPAEYQCCPSCQGGTQAAAPEPRLVHTRGGEADWQEPHAYCRRCRRAFFPSVQEPGH
jgi:hypothetical protein